MQFVTSDLSTALNEMPSWTARIGTKIFAWASILVLAVSLGIPWTEEVSIEVRIHSSGNSSTVSAPQAGRLLDLLVAEGDSVRQGDVLATMGELSDQEMAEEIEAYSAELGDALVRQMHPLPIPPLMFGGPVHDDYAQLTEALELAQTYELVRPDETTASDLALVRNNLRNRQADLLRQLEMAREVIEVQSERLESLQELVEKGWVTRDYLTPQRTLLLEKEMAVASIEGQINSTGEELGLLDSRTANLQRTDSLREAEGRARIQRSLGELRASLDRWLRNNRIVAPISGRIFYQRRIGRGEWLEANEQYAVVASDGPGLIAQGLVSMNSQAAVEVGQTVEILFPNYPHETHGWVSGTVARVSRAATGDSYQAEIALPDGLRTSTGYEIPLMEGMTGSARIRVKQGNVLDVLLGAVNKVYS